MSKRQTSYDSDFKAWIGGPVAPDGTQVQCDLPKELHLQNCGGSDGAGLCVFTSLNHSAYWQNIVPLQKFRDWMRRYPGGGYPDKVTRMMAKYCQEQGVAVPDTIQIESRDLDKLELACKTGRMPGVTFSFSPAGRYGGRPISHMVSLAGANLGPNKLFVTLDNNFPGTYEWMSRKDFTRTYCGQGQGWAVIFAGHPGPAPVPRN